MTHFHCRIYKHPFPRYPTSRAIWKISFAKVRTYDIDCSFGGFDRSNKILLISTSRNLNMKWYLSAAPVELTHNGYVFARSFLIRFVEPKDTCADQMREPMKFTAQEVLLAIPSAKYIVRLVSYSALQIESSCGKQLICCN